MNALRLDDLRLAFRRLRKDPGATIDSVAAPALEATRLDLTRLREE
jgi:hypothetical protein